MKHEERIFLLIDVNNMYVACERVFNPLLNNQPVIVLSNGDGCVVARSPEAKLLGIKMSDPLFRIKNLVQEKGVIVLSSNYVLYGEMSRRFHKILSEFVEQENHEPYSIDEGFLELTNYKSIYNFNDCAKEIKNRLQMWLGLPVCVGIGRTKTEAKMMNHIAKTYPHLNGICNVFDIAEVKKLVYSKIDVGEVWGVGRKHKLKLQEMKINTVYDLMKAPVSHIESIFSVVLKRTVLELNGMSCIDIEHTPPTRKQIVSSRTFGKRITELSHLKEAISRRTQEAYIRARKEKVLIGCVIVFVHSNPFDQTRPFYKKEISTAFNTPTDDLRILIRSVTKMIEQAYQKGIDFKKCGVILTGLEFKELYAYDLLTNYDSLDKTEKLMKTIESVQDSFGTNKIGFGASMLKDRAWNLTADYKTQNYFSFAGMLKI